MARRKVIVSNTPLLLTSPSSLHSQPPSLQEHFQTLDPMLLLSLDINATYAARKGQAAPIQCKRVPRVPRVPHRQGISCASAPGLTRPRRVQLKGSLQPRLCPVQPSDPDKLRTVHSATRQCSTQSRSHPAFATKWPAPQASLSLDGA